MFCQLAAVSVESKRTGELGEPPFTSGCSGCVSKNVDTRLPC